MFSITRYFPSSLKLKAKKNIWCVHLEKKIDKIQRQNNQNNHQKNYFVHNETFSFGKSLQDKHKNAWNKEIHYAPTHFKDLV